MQRIRGAFRFVVDPYGFTIESALKPRSRVTNCTGVRCAALNNKLTFRVEPEGLVRSIDGNRDWSYCRDSWFQILFISFSNITKPTTEAPLLRTSYLEFKRRLRVMLKNFTIKGRLSLRLGSFYSSYAFLMYLDNLTHTAPRLFLLENILRNATSFGDR